MIRLDPTKIIRIYPSWWPAKVPEPDFNFVEATSQLTSLIALATKLTEAYSQLMLSAYSNFSSAYKWKKTSQQSRVKHNQAVGPQHIQKVSYSTPTPSVLSSSLPSPSLSSSSSSSSSPSSSSSSSSLSSSSSSS